MKYLYSIIVIQLLIFNSFCLVGQEADSFSRYNNEVFTYLEIDTTWISQMRVDDEEMIYEYESHNLIKQFCSYDFYSFKKGSICFHCETHIAMIDNERNTIAFLDTLLLTQTIDSINNVLKNCEQETSFKEIQEFYSHIQNIYSYNKSIGFNLRGSYSSPSQTVVYLLSAENSLDFEKAKWYIDYEKIYQSQERWERKVRENPPSLDFHNYWFTVNENGRDAVVNTRYNDKWVRYYLRQSYLSPYDWKVVRIESD